MFRICLDVAYQKAVWHLKWTAKTVTFNWYVGWVHIICYEMFCAFILFDKNSFLVPWSTMHLVERYNTFISKFYSRPSRSWSWIRIRGKQKYKYKLFTSVPNYLCLFEHSGVQYILCCVFVLLVFVLCTLCCQFF
jgi:hypothetical protein